MLLIQIAEGHAFPGTAPAFITKALTGHGTRGAGGSRVAIDCIPPTGPKLEHQRLAYALCHRRDVMIVLRAKEHRVASSALVHHGRVLVVAVPFATRGLKHARDQSER